MNVGLVLGSLVSCLAGVASARWLLTKQKKKPIKNKKEEKLGSEERVLRREIHPMEAENKKEEQLPKISLKDNLLKMQLDQEVNQTDEQALAHRAPPSEASYKKEAPVIKRPPRARMSPNIDEHFVNEPQNHYPEQKHHDKKFFRVRFKSNKGRNKSGAGGERRVMQAISCLHPELFRAYHDVLIRRKSGHTTQMDHVILSPYGIFCIETKRWQGIVTGGEDAKTWQQSNQGRTHRYGNPILQNEWHIDSLKQLLEGIALPLEFPFVSLIVFVDTKEVNVNVTKKNTHVLYVEQLVDLIQEEYCWQLITKDDLEKLNNILQTANILDPEVRKEHVESKITKHKKRKQTQTKGPAKEPEDELFQEAVRIVRETQQASVSLLQRRLRVGYTRAARLVDMMESYGIVGPYEGNKPREVFVSQ